MDSNFERLWRCAEQTKLPGFVRSVSYGTPSLKLGSTFLARIREKNVLAIHCPIEEKPHLLEAAPEIYFETDHYKGWPYILIHLEQITNEELEHRIRIAWKARAPARLRKLADAPHEQRP
ncbi:MAG: MmcQ/YjbR family DNA-binding protein [Phyllobacterium sp.]